MKITPREKRLHAAGRLIFLSPRRVSPFLAWGDFHARSRFARSTIPEEKWGTTRSLGSEAWGNETKEMMSLEMIFLSYLLSLAAKSEF